MAGPAEAIGRFVKWCAAKGWPINLEAIKDKKSGCWYWEEICHDCYISPGEYGGPLLVRVPHDYSAFDYEALGAAGHLKCIVVRYKSMDYCRIITAPSLPKYVFVLLFIQPIINFMKARRKPDPIAARPRRRGGVA